MTTFMKYLLTIGFLSIFLISCGTNTDTTNSVKDTTNKNEIEQTVEETEQTVEETEQETEKEPEEQEEVKESVEEKSPATEIKLTYSYNSSQYLTNTLIQVWDIASANWRNNLQTLYTNNASGLVTQRVQQAYNPTTTTWVNTARTSYTYNAANKPTVVIREIWTGTSWLNSAKDSYSYGTNNALTYLLSQEWSNASSTWVNSLQELYTNNTDGSVNQIIQQEWVDNTWSNTYRTSYIYNPLAVEAFSQGMATAYPNPTRGVINIKAGTTLSGAAYSVLDQSGKTLSTGSFDSENASIDVGAFAAGVYFIQIGKYQPLRVIKN